MSEICKSPKSVAAGLLLLLGSVGCSHHTPANSLKIDKTPIVGPAPAAPFSGVLNCKALMPEKWMKTPTNLNLGAVAMTLHVTVESVQNGVFGGATCDERIAPSQTVGAIANVAGEGTTCAVVGVGEDPSLVKTTNKILAVCTAGITG